MEGNTSAAQTADSPDQTNPAPPTSVPLPPVADPAVRFRGLGTNFRAKLIGVDDVPDSRGDEMCQESILKLKAAVQASGRHKQKIVVNVSLEGIKIVDVLTGEVQHVHPVHRISFIARDLTDRRAFGYVYGAGEGRHQFFGIKTAKVAEVLVLALRDLFQVVYDMKKKEIEEAKEENMTNGTEERPAPVPAPRLQQPQGEDVYAAPQRKQQEGNLFDLEQQLTTIQEGINNIDAIGPWPQDLPTSPDSNAGDTNGDLFGIAIANLLKDEQRCNIPLLPPPPSSLRSQKKRSPTGRLLHPTTFAITKKGSFSSVSSSLSSCATSHSCPSEDSESFFTCSTGSNTSSNVAPQKTSSYSDELFDLASPVAQPAPQPGARLTKEQILSSFGTNVSQQGMFPGQGGMMMPPQAGMVPQSGMQYNPGYQQQMPGFPQAAPPMGMFPPGPSPAIPPRPGAMRPPTSQPLPGGAAQNPFGDSLASGTPTILAPVNNGPIQKDDSPASQERADPFAGLIPGMGASAAANKKDMFKNFQMAKPPQPPPRTNPPVNSSSTPPTAAPKPDSNFNDYFLNSVGGVPLTDDLANNNSAQAVKGQPNEIDPFGMGGGQTAHLAAGDPFGGNQAFSQPVDFNQGASNGQSLFG